MVSYKGGYKEEEPEARRLWVKQHTEVHCWLRDHHGFTDERARSEASCFLGPFPLSQERFAHLRFTGELQNDLRICGWSIGEIQSQTNCSLPDLFSYFHDAFTVPWA
jgi:hypothetical protein